MWGLLVLLLFLSCDASGSGYTACSNSCLQTSAAETNIWFQMLIILLWSLMVVVSHTCWCVNQSKVANKYMHVLCKLAFISAASNLSGCQQGCWQLLHMKRHVRRQLPPQLRPLPPQPTWIRSRQSTCAAAAQCPPWPLSSWAPSPAFCLTLLLRQGSMPPPVLPLQRCHIHRPRLPQSSQARPLPMDPALTYRAQQVCQHDKQQCATQFTRRSRAGCKLWLGLSCVNTGAMRGVHAL